MDNIRARPQRYGLRQKLLLGGAGLLTILIGTGIATWIWYVQQLSPVNASSTETIRVVIESGETPDSIADTLENAQVIRNSVAFLIYTRIEGVRGSLQAGEYALSPANSTAEIVNRLVTGDVEAQMVTFYPGATLTDTTDTPQEKKYDITKSLLAAGYTQAEVAAALSADYSEYSDTLFRGRPSTADLEGYIYGDTYHLASGATAEQAIRAALDEFVAIIKDNKLEEKFAAQNLTLFEGITLASIVQKEAIGGDEAKIAQVFYARLAIGMPLGSDVTYQYIADKTGLARDPELQSEYNTRKVVGLPPGPIATPGLAALRAVAEPADTDYLFFLSGDDDVTYFARTLEEHEANKVNHCQEKCQIL